MISVDNTRRFFRTRCLKGCETKHSLNDGCSRSQLYGDLNNAKNALSDEIYADVRKCDEKMNQVKATRAFVIAQHNKMAESKAPKVPRAIK